MATTSDTLVVLLNILWAALNASCWLNPRFRIVLPSHERMFELFYLTSFTFCPGLFAILKASAPPSIEWFRALSSFPPKDVWGIYIIVLTKRGHRHLLYTGSATAAARGVRSRFGEYDSHKHLGRNVKKALQNGYKIHHKALLAWCSIPKASKIPFYRIVVIALEAALSCSSGQWPAAIMTMDLTTYVLGPWNLSTTMAPVPTTPSWKELQEILKCLKRNCRRLRTTSVRRTLPTAGSTTNNNAWMPLLNSKPHKPKQMRSRDQKPSCSKTRLVQRSAFIAMSAILVAPTTATLRNTRKQSVILRRPLMLPNLLLTTLTSP